MIGAIGEDSCGEIATILRPRRAQPEEAQGRPLDKRSRLRKSTAVLIRLSKLYTFSVASRLAEEAPQAPRGKRSRLWKSTAALAFSQILKNGKGVSDGESEPIART
ncbi:hypothetical protein EKQ44_11425 [Sutcliffiella horikoshii]|nr:hypothetical protein [Sutcliffiella horikoshii]